MLVFHRRGLEIHAKAQLAENARLERVPLEKAGGNPSADKKPFREAWLDSRAAAR